MRLPIYLDYAATTPVDKRVKAKMLEYFTYEDHFGNPASLHSYGKNALTAVEQARCQVAELINAQSREIIWTSGATEADNLAIIGAAEFYQHKGKHIITSAIEHKAVLDTCAHLARRGFEITYLKPESSGIIALEKLVQAIRADTILVSIMHVNNELGVVQDLQAISQICHQHKIIFHVDAAQSAGKLAIDVQAMDVDLMSLSAHKAYGPKGVGALYVRHKPRVRLVPLIHGGGHEQGLRSGTLPTAQIVGMGEAFAIAKQELATEPQRLWQLRKKFVAGLMPLTEIYLHGDQQNCVPGIINLGVNYIDSDALLMALNKMAISSGSACTSASIEISHVLRAIDIDSQLAQGSVRISLGRFTTEADIDYAIEYFCQQVQRLRDISPLWEMHQQGKDIQQHDWNAH